MPGIAAWIDENNRDRKHTGFGMQGPLDDELALRAGTRHDRKTTA